MNEPTITVTKIDAARRQLDTAIGLWFNGGDPVAIHALAYFGTQTVDFAHGFIFRRKTVQY